MTVDDLPERLRHLGGQPVTGEIVNVLITEKDWKEKGWGPFLLELSNVQVKESA